MLIHSFQDIVNRLLKNQVGVIPTDTIYGLVTLASNQEGIDRLFKIKKRPINKKIPILVASLEQLSEFVQVNAQIKEYVSNALEPTTCVYPLLKSWEKQNLFFDQKKVAIRLVKWEWLKKIILKTGPLAATSCNISGEKNINEWKKLSFLIPQVDFAVNKKPLGNKPSRIFDWVKKIYLR